MPGSILLPLTDPPPVTLTPLHHSLQIQHVCTKTQLARSCSLPTIDGLMGQGYPHAVNQICLKVSFLPLCITFEGKLRLSLLHLGMLLSEKTLLINFIYVIYLNEHQNKHLWIKFFSENSLLYENMDISLKIHLFSVFSNGPLIILLFYLF